MGYLFQLPGPDALGKPPTIALKARNDFHINLAGRNLFESGQKSWGASHAFSHGALNKGQWVEFMMDVVWAADSSGGITVHRRDQGLIRWTQVFQARNTPTLQYKTGKAVGTHYWKAGYYRYTPLNFKSQLQLGPIARGVSVDQMTAWSNHY